MHWSGHPTLVEHSHTTGAWALMEIGALTLRASSTCAWPSCPRGRNEPDRQRTQTAAPLSAYVCVSRSRWDTRRRRGKAHTGARVSPQPHAPLQPASGQQATSASWLGGLQCNLLMASEGISDLTQREGVGRRALATGHTPHKHHPWHHHAAGRLATRGKAGEARCARNLTLWVSERLRTAGNTRRRAGSAARTHAHARSGGCHRGQRGRG